MTEEEIFVKQFWEIKKNAGLMKFPIGSLDITRGNRVISSDFEDLFGIYVAKKINRTDYKYFIDKSFSYKIDDKTRGTFKPDLLVVNELNEAVGYFDVKTDLGSYSNFEKFLKEKLAIIKKIRVAKKTRLSQEPKSTYKVCDNIKYVVVVGIDHQRTNKIPSFKKICEESEGLVDIYFLTHWENWSKIPQPEFTPREEDFKRLNTYLKTL